MFERISKITCPECGHTGEKRMPETSCQIHCRCEHCGATLRPKSRDCCVFCSHGSVPCPPVQQEGRLNDAESDVH